MVPCVVEIVIQSLFQEIHQLDPTAQDHTFIQRGINRLLRISTALIPINLFVLEETPKILGEQLSTI